MKHADKKDFRWFTTIHNGILGVHKDKLRSLSYFKETNNCHLFLTDGVGYQLHPDHHEEAQRVFSRR